jgi:hypothetical protein
MLKYQNFQLCKKYGRIYNIVTKHPVAFIYTSYTLKYSVFNATLLLSFFFLYYSTTCFGDIGP